jgi:glycosyltransferase involved in cell wall biosynthesis
VGGLLVDRTEDLQTGPVPRVSVGLIFLNEQQFIEEAVQSVLGQTLADWELILVDDGSTDRSTTIAQAFAAEDERIRYIDHPGHANRGMSVSRNLGVAHSNSPYVAFLDADDVWVPEKLAEQVNLLESMPDVAMVCGAMRHWYSWDPASAKADRLVLTGGMAERRVDPPDAVLAIAPLGGSSPSGVDVLVRRSVFDSVGGFEERFHEQFEDQAFLVKVFLRYPVYISSRGWLLWRRHNASSTAQTTATVYWRARGVFLNWFGEDPGRIADSRVRAAFRQARRELLFRRLAAPAQDVLAPILDRFSEDSKKRVKRALGGPR